MPRPAKRLHRHDLSKAFNVLHLIVGDSHLHPYSVVVARTHQLEPYSPSTNFMDMEFTQCRAFSGVRPSPKNT